MSRDSRRPVQVCRECREEHPHEAQGLCRRCYDRHRKTPDRSRGRTAVGEAIGRLLPVPAMVRCGGCADVPACDRAARADVGYCWRCQQARAVAA